jgi:hypothetical protein
LVDVDIGSSSSILLMTLMTGVDPAVALLAHFIRIACNIGFVRIGNRRLGMISNSLVASIVSGNRWQFAVHGFLLSLALAEILRKYLRCRAARHPACPQAGLQLSLAASRRSTRSRRGGFARMKLERKIGCDAAGDNENRRYENHHAVTCLWVAIHFASCECCDRAIWRGFPE